MRVIGRSTKSDLQIDEDVDSNSETITTSIVMGDATKVGLYVSAKSGTHNNHIITLQVSPDNASTWADTSNTIIGTGFLDNITVIGTNIRTKITTVEGEKSTVDVSLVIK